MNLTSNTILITGGGAGIGLALARQLAERGNRVIICGRSEAALLQAQAQVPDLLIRVCDITDQASRQAMLNWLSSEHPKLNILVNNAGIQHRRLFSDADALADLEQEVATNFTAPVRLIGELLPLLKQQPSATIINVTSALAYAPIADLPACLLRHQGSHAFVYAHIAPSTEGNRSAGGGTGATDRRHRAGRQRTQRRHGGPAHDDAARFCDRSAGAAGKRPG